MDREQIGIQKGKIEIVSSLNHDHISMEQIAKHTRLSTDEVGRILKENNREK